MTPKPSGRRRRAQPSRLRSPSPSPEDGMFSGMIVFLIPNGVQMRRIQIWKQKLVQMGAVIESSLSKKVTHVFAMNSEKLLQQVKIETLQQFKGCVLSYEWLENSLKSGDKVSEGPYKLMFQGINKPKRDSSSNAFGTSETANSDGESPNSKKTKVSTEDLEVVGTKTNNREIVEKRDEHGESGNQENVFSDKVDASQSLSLYNPPDLNKNITETFGKLINIYRALGEDRRSFSYYKAIPVIEKLPFKIESVEQVKDLPTIGKSLQEHIHEIITTGKFSKLEHFENDEKVRTVSLFGEVWGIGPATAMKLYEKGHRTLEDLKHDNSLTHAQRMGLKYFEDIKQRIPRNEVKEMEMLLQKSAQEILPGVVVVCGGSYRRGKASCGDMDIIITHPDDESHRGFLPRYVQYLKDINFLREDLVFSTHSTEGTDSGVDTYFGLCTYPGRDLRHRIDLKNSYLFRSKDLENFCLGLPVLKSQTSLFRRICRSVLHQNYS